MTFDQVMRVLLFLPEAGTYFADSIDHLHFFVISVTMLGSAIVFFAALVFMIRYRRVGEPTLTPRVQASRFVEGAFISGLLGLFILWWVIGFHQYITYAAPPRDADDVYVTAKQWMWKFSYPDGRATVAVLVVPVNRDVRLVLTSRDVIHSFYVPAFRLKQDALPGRYTTAWFKARRAGTFDLYCAEYCGTSHSRMWASVVVLRQEDYERWLGGDEPEPVAVATARAALGDQGALTVAQGTLRVGQDTLSMAEQGRRAATKKGCFACHTIDGQRYIGPSWRGLFGKVVELEGGGQIVADEAYLTRSMMDPRADIVRGFRPLMPTYLGVLRQPEAAAIVEFIKSLDRSPGPLPVLLPEVRALNVDAGVEPGLERPALTGDAGGVEPDRTGEP